MVDADVLQRWHQWASQARASELGGVTKAGLITQLEDEIFAAYVDCVREELKDTERPTGEETEVRAFGELELPFVDTGEPTL